MQQEACGVSIKALGMPESCICFRQKDHDGTQTSVLPVYRTEVVLHGIQPDEEGGVTIVRERQNELNSNVYFLELLLDEEG